MELILASASPRRLALLREAGYDPRVAAVALDETPRLGERPTDLVLRLAEAKARAAAAGCSPGRRDRVVLAADTEVVLAGRALGKPRDEAGAVRMLLALAGRSHEVATGVCLLRTSDGRMLRAVESSRVTFRAIDASQARAYAATGEPLDKAGAYAIQGGAAAFVERVEGSWANVVGLPVERIGAWLARLAFQGADARLA